VLDSAGKVEQCMERILEIFEDGSVKVCDIKNYTNICGA
jgi:hypothetical protein